MKVAIVFATIEGQTGKIARFLESEIAGEGHEVCLHDVSHDMVEVSLEGAEKVILAAPVHERRHPEGFEVFLAARKRDLAAPHTLFLSVSMSAAFPEGMEEANEYVVESKMRTGFEPDDVELVAGAVRTSKYDYFASQVIRHVVMRGREYDAGEGEHEFTDWEGLRARVMGFLEVAYEGEG